MILDVLRSMDGWRLRRKAASMVALCLAIVAVDVSSSGAAGSPTVAVSPATGLVDQQTVTVTWKNWPLRGGRSNEAYLMECYQGWQYYTTGDAQGIEFCSHQNPAFLTMQRTRRGKITFTVALQPDDSSHTAQDCNHFPGGCWIVLANRDNRTIKPAAWAYANGAPIAFAPS